MSALLYLPGLLVVLFKRHGLMGTVRYMIYMAAVQIFLARPFIGEHLHSYLRNAFDFSRVFLYRWTVNWRFVDEQTFLSPMWARSLLLGHITVLVAFGLYKWCQSDGGALTVIRRGLRRPSRPAGLSPVSPDCLFSFVLPAPHFHAINRCCNGVHDLEFNWHLFCSVIALSVLFVVFPTTSVPVSKDKIPVPSSVRVLESHFSSPVPNSRVPRLAILAGIEYAWNVFPSTTASSGILLAANISLLLGIWFGFPEGRLTASRSQ